MDYGEAHALEDSLRCFKGHEEVCVYVGAVSCIYLSMYVPIVWYVFFQRPLPLYSSLSSLSLALSISLSVSSCVCSHCSCDSRLVCSCCCCRAACRFAGLHRQAQKIDMRASCNSHDCWISVADTRMSMSFGYNTRFSTFFKAVLCEFVFIRLHSRSFPRYLLLRFPGLSSLPGRVFSGRPSAFRSPCIARFDPKSMSHALLLPWPLSLKRWMPTRLEPPAAPPLVYLRPRPRAYKRLLAM